MRCKFSCTFASAVAWLVLAWAAPLALAQAKSRFDIPAQPLADSLRAVGARANLNVLFDPPLVVGRDAPALKGEFTTSQAFTLLLVGTGITHEFLNENTVVLGSSGARDERSRASDDPSSGKRKESSEGRVQVHGAQREGPMQRELEGNPSLWQRFRLAQSAAANTADAPASNTEPENVRLEEVIVTGVFRGIDRRAATVAVSTVDAQLLEKLVPVSTSDLLRNVPGVYVDSSQGEIRSNIITRGLSGHYYISLQEDGLPVTRAALGNYSPDYFLRADATVARVEAVRGGSASITTANAPGGIYNYISKTGGDTFAAVVSTRLGLQADGKSPQYRGDLSLGGPLAGNWTYNVGGFYRSDEGAHDADYAVNYGGQLKANVVRRFDNGSLQFYGKYLDDHNAAYSAIPARYFDSPEPWPGFSTTSSELPPQNSAFRYQTGANSFETWDPENQWHSRSGVIGFKLDFDLGNGWSIANNGKYIDAKSYWDIGGTVTPDFVNEVAFLSTFTTGTAVPAGTFVFRDPGTGGTARVTGGVVTSNTLPGAGTAVGNQNLLREAAFSVRTRVKEWMDQFSVTKTFDRMSLTAGAFLSHSAADSFGYCGLGWGTFTEQPRMVDISFEPASGSALQFTNPQGFLPPLTINLSGTYPTQDELAFFFGQRWEFASKWNLDWGVRHERNEIESASVVTGQNSVARSTTGGLDGNANTIYDNAYPVYGPLIATGDTVNTLSYSAAIGRELDQNSSLYARYSVGKKAPDMTFYSSLNNPTVAGITPSVAQTLTQYELGYKLFGPADTLVVTPFYSLLEDVPQYFYFADITGPVNTNYTRVGTSTSRRYGVEVEGEHQFPQGFALRALLTWQKAVNVEASRWVQLVSGDPSTDSEITLASGTRVENIPSFLAMVTPSYRRGRFYGQVQWNYIGKRLGNTLADITFPSYQLTDVTLQWTLTDKLDVGVTANNIFNEFGISVMQNPGGIFGIPGGFTRAYVDANPNQLFSVIATQPRAYYLTVNYRF